MQFGTNREPMLVIEECANTRTVTVLVRAGNKMALAEAKRCLHDANCCVRNLIVNPSIIPGGGASEIAASLAIVDAADREPSIDQYSMKGRRRLFMKKICWLDAGSPWSMPVWF